MKLFSKQNRRSLEEIKESTKKKRYESIRKIVPNEYDKRNFDIWNKEFRDLWPAIYKTIK